MGAECTALAQSAVTLDGTGAFKKSGEYTYTRLLSWSDVASCPRSPNGTDVFDSVMCQKCGDSAIRTVSFAITGALESISQLQANLQRATRFGDVNCQATMGRITSFIGFFSGIMALQGFATGCWQPFQTQD